MTREMSRPQFSAALKRNGFSTPILFWVYSRDNPNISYSMLFTTKGKVLRRATIAHLLQSRERDRAKSEKRA
jgi:hypothetical protein